jgi:hypothetical protein
MGGTSQSGQGKRRTEGHTTPHLLLQPRTPHTHTARQPLTHLDQGQVTATMYGWGTKLASLARGELVSKGTAPA